MKLFARAPANDEGVVWLMIYEDPSAGTYLFGSTKATDGGEWDEWHATMQEAQKAAFATYGIPLTAWQQVADPLEHCQHDWLQPVRVKGRNLGQPEWGKLEKLLDGKWVDFDSNTQIIPL